MKFRKEKKLIDLIKTLLGVPNTEFYVQSIPSLGRRVPQRDQDPESGAPELGRPTATEFPKVFCVSWKAEVRSEPSTIVHSLRKLIGDVNEY